LSFLHRYRFLFQVLLPVILGCFLLVLYKDSIRASAEIGLGKRTSAFNPERGDFRIHIMNPVYADTLVKGWKRRGSRDPILWLGNSQLHGINLYQQGQQNAVGMLWDSLQSLNREVVGVSYPNANLQELLASLLLISHKLPVKDVLIPLFYDDLREDGLRAIIQTDELKEICIKRQQFVSGLPSFEALTAANTELTPKEQVSPDFEGIKETTQDKTERFLNMKASGWFDTWEKRADMRGNIFNSLYNARNQMMGIDATTIRKMIPGRYRANLLAFHHILDFCNNKQIRLTVYIPPLRNDAPIPYESDLYKEFKMEVRKECLKTGAHFLDLEKVVPNQYWDRLINAQEGSVNEQLDFMHFQQEGHRLVADTIFHHFVSLR
jgi:hypothetical protein